MAEDKEIRKWCGSPTGLTSNIAANQAMVAYSRFLPRYANTRSKTYSRLLTPAKMFPLNPSPFAKAVGYADQRAGNNAILKVTNFGGAFPNLSRICFGRCSIPQNVSTRMLCPPPTSSTANVSKYNLMSSIPLENQTGPILADTVQ